MQTNDISSAAELKSFLASLPTDTIFRGQNKHYTASDGSINLPTSFERHGCIPSLTLKWTHYSRSIIGSLRGPGCDMTASLHEAQAVLQHYGWRSFFIDATSTPAIAAWFASHAFTRLPDTLHGTEDCYEEFLFRVHERATYTASAEPISHLYAISLSQLQSAGVEVYNLPECLPAKDCIPRYVAQAAYLIGPLKTRLPPQSVIAHAFGPTEIFADYAAEHGIRKQADLFPDRQHDPILKLLLSVPWKHRVTTNDISVFSRGLPIPEYDFENPARHQTNEAFYTTFWIADDHDDPDSPVANAAYFRTPEEVFYGLDHREPYRLTAVTSLLHRFPTIVVESSGLLRHPESFSSSSYLKGIVIQQSADGAVVVSELVADHAGMSIEGYSITLGWHYSTDGDQTWLRIDHPDQCPCNNRLKHLHHMSTLIGFEDMLRQNMYTQTGQMTFEHKFLQQR